MSTAVFDINLDKNGDVITEDEIAWRQVCDDMYGETLTGFYAHWCEFNNGAPIDETCSGFSTCRCFGEIDLKLAARANEITRYLDEHAKFRAPWRAMWKKWSREDKLRLSPYLSFLIRDSIVLIVRSTDGPEQEWRFTEHGNFVNYIYTGDGKQLVGNLPLAVVERMILSKE